MISLEPCGPLNISKMRCESLPDPVSSDFRKGAVRLTVTVYTKPRAYSAVPPQGAGQAEVRKFDISLDSKRGTT